MPTSLFASLRSASLCSIEADLTGAHLVRAKLPKADLSDADLTRADLMNADWVSSSDLAPAVVVDCGPGCLSGCAGPGVLVMLIAWSGTRV